MQDGETPRPKLDIVKLKEEAARRSEADKQAFNLWWESISQDRQKEYSELSIISSDVENKEYVLRKCRYLLELMSGLESTDRRKFVPVGLAIHGDLPVVYYQAQGHETARWESYKEMTQFPNFSGEAEERFYSDIDTSKYGIASIRSGPFGYKMDSLEVEKRIGWMK